jgi:hypothetical protein
MLFESGLPSTDSTCCALIPSRAFPTPAFGSMRTGGFGFGAGALVAVAPTPGAGLVSGLFFVQPAAMKVAASANTAIRLIISFEFIVDFIFIIFLTFVGRLYHTVVRWQEIFSFS